MNRSKLISSVAIFIAIFLSSLGTSLAQADPKTITDSNYEVVLQVVLGTSEPGSASLPKNLSAISNQLKTNFTFSNYKLVNTYLGRVADTGSLEYKSIANIYGQEQETDQPSFLDWRLTNFRRSGDVPARSDIQIQSFRFGARVPIRTGTAKDSSGNAQPIFNYETLGLTLDRLSVPENSPTLIGTLSLPKTTGTAFLVMTVKTIEK